jgi:hypothetical protein
MNDHELDELLDHWTAPSPPVLLRPRVRAEFRALRQPRKLRPLRKRWLAVTLLAAAALFAFLGNAISQTPAVIPAAWTVDSEFLRNGPNGSATIEMKATSYSVDGNEVLWSRSDPRNPMATAVFRAADVALPALGRAMGRAFGYPVIKRPVNSNYGYIPGCLDQPAGCLQVSHYFFFRAADTCLAGSVVGEQTILNHSTIGVRVPMGDSLRMTFWMAPDLACFALKIQVENRLPDGAFHLVSEKRAVRISATAGK